MHCIHRARSAVLYSIIQHQHITSNIVNVASYKIINRHKCKLLHTAAHLQEQETVAKPLRNTKPKAQENAKQGFVDIQQVRTIGGKGGDGLISFLQLWANDHAGPDGGDGGNGGHVIFQVTSDVKDLSHIDGVLKAEHGEKGYNKNCFGRNAKHTVINVPMGTIVRNTEGKILADLNQLGMLFIAARGGAGGHGNTYFKSNMQQTPQISEYGASGEDIQYVLEVRSMAHIGLIGLPNAGKSTLLRAISRARPKVASYPFTTLKPHLGIVLYDDYEHVTVADMPGLIADSHKNKGLGIQFLKHIERCAVLVFILDVTLDEPWADLQTLRHEIEQFNVKLNDRPQLIVANKMDVPQAKEKLEILKQKVDLPVISISAKMGTNISILLKDIRILYDKVRRNSTNDADNSISYWGLSQNRSEPSTHICVLFSAL